MKFSWVSLGQIFLWSCPLLKNFILHFYPIIQEKITYYSKKLAVSGMTQCDCLTDHGINLPIQFKLVVTVQFLHCTYMYLYLTLCIRDCMFEELLAVIEECFSHLPGLSSPFDHTNWPPDMAVAHFYAHLCMHSRADLKPIIQLLQEATYYSKKLFAPFGPGLLMSMRYQ